MSGVIIALKSNYPLGGLSFQKVGDIGSASKIIQGVEWSSREGHRCRFSSVIHFYITEHFSYVCFSWFTLDFMRFHLIIIIILRT